MTDAPAAHDLKCGFCGKPRSDVKKLIAGPNPNAIICDECVSICVLVMASEDREWFRRQFKEMVDQLLDNEVGPPNSS